VTKREATQRIREVAYVIRQSLDGDEGAEEWATELELIAAQLDPKVTA
jgi:hypothetical protein